MAIFNYYSKSLNKIIKIEYYTNGNKIDKAFYFFDGQNVFDDDKATFKKSLRIKQYLDKHFKNYLVVGLHSPKTDEGRLNLYTPFKITNGYIDNFKNDTKICHTFIDEFLNKIIPSLEQKYEIKNRILYGSSLAAILTSYIVSITDKFSYAIIQSLASFIVEKDFYKHLNNNINTYTYQYITVGKKESSDGQYNNKLYLNEAINYHNYLNKNNIQNELKISKFGIHDEISWRKQLNKIFKKLAKRI